MNLTITGAVKQVGPVEQGQGQSGPWQKMEFTVEEVSQQFPGSVCLTIFGEEKVRKYAPLLRVGAMVVAKFDIRARQYTDKDGKQRMANNVNCWSVEAYSVTGQQQQPQQPQQPQMGYGAQQVAGAFQAQPVGGGLPY